MTRAPATLDRPLTDQQRAALSARNVSVSLAAGAGCGKTFVLTERFISHLNPMAEDAAADLDELVAITFTDAAAREMRDRIRRRCLERLQGATDAREGAAWQRLMRAIDGARISTIHAFCTALLRRHAVEAGLDLQFEVLDAAAADLLRLETVDDRLRALLIAQHEDVLNLAAKRGLDRLRSDVASFAGPMGEEARRQWRDATPDELVARWIQFFQEEVHPAAVQELLDSSEVRELRDAAGANRACSDKLRAHLDNLERELCGIGAADEPAAALDRLHELAKVQGICTAKDWHDAEDYGRFRDAAKAFRELIAKSALRKSLDLEASREAASLGLALVRLASDVAAVLEQTKAARNQLEFDDLLVRTHGLLTGPAQAAIRRDAARGARLMMVDEFQDTNPLQTDIIKAFCGEDWSERGLFAVGDFKQSIYRFTGAVPQVSTALRESLPAAGRLSLTTNFRSQPAVLDFVNAVFHDAFVDYEPLAPARPQTTATPAVEFMWAPAGTEAHEGDGAPAPKRRRRGATLEARAVEARWIARRLAELLDSPEPLVVDAAAGTPTPRRLRPGDVAILLRSLSDAQVYEEALREQGLDYYLAGGHAFYSQQEIFDVLNLLVATASRVDEIALAGALRSPLFALADETLFWMVQAHGSLNAALAAAAPPAELAADEAAKARRAAATLGRLRREKDRLLVAELLNLALELTGFDAVLLCEFLGPRKAANIKKLVEQARAHDRTSPGDLAGFITQLSEFVVRAPKEPLAATQAQGDVIRIMSIHYAKGLEFPLVVLPDLERGRHPGGSDPVLDARLGPLVPLENRTGAVGLDLHRHIENLHDLEERKRLLYVACTRAADYLILSSSVADLERPRGDWLQLVDRTVSLADGSLRRTLPPGYGAPQIRVVTDPPRGIATDEGRSRGPDLQRLVDKTRELSATGGGRAPREAAAMPVDAAARRRFSFSRLSGQLVAEARLVAPAEAPIIRAAAGSFSSVELGRLIHAVMERLDFRQPEAAADLCRFLAPQEAPGAPGPAANRAWGMIERFLASPRGEALSRARTVRREVEFVLPWPPRDGGFRGRYLQGYLDCLYQDEHGRWRLLDYKSNRVSRADVSKAAERYELQMLAYSLACERALGEPLAACGLELLDPGVEYCFTWDAAARSRAIERITTAMDAAGVAEVEDWLPLT